MCLCLCLCMGMGMCSCGRRRAPGAHGMARAEVGAVRGGELVRVPDTEDGGPLALELLGFPDRKKGRPSPAIVEPLISVALGLAVGHNDDDLLVPGVRGRRACVELLVGAVEGSPGRRIRPA